MADRGEPDPIFSHPRLAAVHDPLDPDRSDLDAYAAILVDELGARSLLDVGCGTGTFAIRMAGEGLVVTGVDPAAASVDVARGKPGSEAVAWVTGTVEAVEARGFDAATMTANVAQVFVDETEWRSALVAIRDRLREGGTLVLESRRPERRAWEEWTRERTQQVVDVPHEGLVEDWVQVTEVDERAPGGPIVRFDSPTVFHRDGVRIDSASTLRFRSREAIEASLVAAGLEVVDVRDAPDRPGREWVHLARRPGGRSA